MFLRRLRILLVALELGDVAFARRCAEQLVRDLERLEGAEQRRDELAALERAGAAPDAVQPPGSAAAPAPPGFVLVVAGYLEGEIAAALEYDHDDEDDIAASGAG